MAEQTPPQPALTWHPSLTPYTVPAAAYLAHHAKTWNGLGTTALVYDARNRVLLLQRAPHDSMPLRWEAPGGAVDAADASILAGCARELREEAGLVATRFVRGVARGEGLQAGSVHADRTGKRFYCRFAFEVVVREGEVRLDPEEHVDWVWASEEEVRAGRMGDGKGIAVTGPIMMDTLLEGWRLRRVEAVGEVE